MALDKKGKPARPKPAIDGKVCTGCSLCIENCPVSCLTLRKEPGAVQETAVLDDAEKCIGCCICRDTCPIGAIRTLLPDGTEVEAPKTLKEGQTMSGKLQTIGCRAFQYTMKVGNYVLGYREPALLKGSGSLAKLPDLLIRQGINDVLFVTDPVIMKLGLPDGLLKSFEEKDIRYTVFSAVDPNPTSDNVEQGVSTYLANGCRSIVAMGGGSPIDCAKGIAARIVHPRKSVKQLQGLLTVHKRIPPFVAIPTTAGTGSETTIAAVITDSLTHHKSSIMDPVLIPRYAVLDPDLTVGLPPFTTATTGIDALCHAVEAYTNHTYNTMLEDRYAKKAVRLIYNNLYKAFQDGSDIDARAKMQEAAFYAGRAFTRGGVGYVHSIGHTLGGLYGVPHGLAMSIILPHVMKAFGPAVYGKLADLADVCGIEGNNEEEKAQAFIRWIEQLKKDMGIPVGLDMIEPEDIDQIVVWAGKEANPIYPVPVVFSKKELKQLVESMMV